MRKMADHAGKRGRETPASRPAGRQAQRASANGGRSRPKGVRAWPPAVVEGAGDSGVRPGRAGYGPFGPTTLDGGFLGMGEHSVAVKYDQLKWVDAPVASTSAAKDRPATATTGQATADAKAANMDRNYPDHAVLDATKDQLKAMPQFNYSK